MTGIKPQTSGIGGNHSTNCATTAPPKKPNFTFNRKMQNLNLIRTSVHDVKFDEHSAQPSSKNQLRRV